MCDHGAIENWGDWQTVLNDVDIETARAIVEAQLEDTAAPASSYGGNRDAALARHLFRQDLRQLQFDFPSRETGERLEEEENELQEALEGAAFGWTLKQWEDRIERVPDPPKSVECVACLDRTHPDKALKAPCGDVYCDDCLEQLYYDCMKDESLFPPRCCQKEFPWQLVRHHLTQQCRSKFGAKRKELETKDRTYCHVPTCSAFIDPATFDGYLWAVCHVCQSMTCADCKGPTHRGRCPRDTSLDELMETAEDNGWQRCYACRQMVELKHGCNHMTCVCKSEFCYKCAVPWKNCPCAQWDEDRLLDQAEAIVDRQPFPDDETDEEREVRIMQTAENLRVFHECDHERFQGIREEGWEYQCEVCSVVYRTWIYQCRQCNMIACNTCRRNRL